MCTRWLIPVAAIAVIAVGGVLILRGGGADERAAGARAAAPAEEAVGSGSLPARDVMVGAVEVSIEPIRIDRSGAVFRVTMDTHSEELSADLAGTSTLEVDGVEWAGAIWSGDGPGGHHREGELAFRAAGRATGPATLTIGGFSAPVEATWTLGA